MINPFDPVRIKFSSEATIFYARPVEFIWDDKSEPVKSTKLVATCPKCGQLNELDVSKDIILADTILDVICKECGKPKDAVVVVPQPTKVNQQLPAPQPLPQQSKPEIEVVMSKLVKQEIKGKSKVEVDDEGFVPNNTFVDPIALGKFHVEEL